MLELRRRRQNDVCVIDRVCLKVFEDDGEQILPFQTSDDALLIRCDRAWIAVVHNERTYGRPRVSERFAELAHVDGAWLSLNKVGPFERGVVVLEKSAG